MTTAQQAWVDKAITRTAKPPTTVSGGSWWAQAAGTNDRESFVTLQRQRQVNAGWGTGYKSRELHMGDFRK